MKVPVGGISGTMPGMLMLIALVAEQVSVTGLPGAGEVAGLAVKDTICTPGGPGGGAFTVMVTFAVAEPNLLVAVRV